MRLDPRAVRYLTSEDWRILTATEIGSKNHELVPTALISKLAGLRAGSGIERSISTLAKAGLIAKIRNAKYDGYRLTYGGLDYLALHTYLKRDEIYSVGNQIGVGKESDIFIVAPPPVAATNQSKLSSRRESSTASIASDAASLSTPKNSSNLQYVLKIHRLGRISFRTVKANRDYLRNRTTSSWKYLSRLAAQKEYAFLKALYEAGFPVPEPIAQSRHTLLMSFIDAYPLRQFTSVPDPAGLYGELIEMIIRLAKCGLIHGDFNEFNVLILEGKPSSETGEDQQTVAKLTPILIDFPQAVSIDHVNADMYFDRDVACIKTFFERRFHFVPTQPGPFLKSVKKEMKRLHEGEVIEPRLDIQVQASGFSKKQVKELESHLEALRDGSQTQEDEALGDEDQDDTGDEDDDDEEDDDEGDNETEVNHHSEIDNVSKDVQTIEDQNQRLVAVSKTPKDIPLPSEETATLSINN